MFNIVIVFVVPVLLPTSVICDGTYECGDHGRFEYCIDEIPGCVIGCHCHPGYYFDTDSKICEPNSKLLQQHRRNKSPQPTQGQIVEVTPSVVYESTPNSDTNKIDNHVDEITKDANDLGDWLYNQFFKTIENQVINNTNDQDALTRRSGSQQVAKPRSRNKYRKGRSKSKKKDKKEHLRRKLLRITENDSLFDISSKSKSDSSDSSSSDSSFEYETNDRFYHKHDDDQHGHKKIVMINKKPKQPLPSFIFLPNMETPYYPPIGLPPPPIVPMYPMVPVPPVPLFRISANSESCTTITQGTTFEIQTATSAAETTASETPKITTVITKSDAIDTTVPSTSIIPGLRNKNRKRKKVTKQLDNNNPYTDQRLSNLKPIDRQKILERLREKMSNPSAKLFMPSWTRNKKIYANTFVNQNTDAENPLLENTLSDDINVNNGIQSKPIHEDLSFPENVDFKYITELIHRGDLNNKTNNFPPVEYNPVHHGSLEMYQPPKMQENRFADYSVPFNDLDRRRSYRPINEQADESYYTNLGRQIAMMIRNIDSANAQVNIELEGKNTKFDPYFNNNSPRSFWERSVRSPITFVQENNKKFEYLKKSNELLFNIENKVEIIASTAPTLSLQEIENMVKVMEVAKMRDDKSNDANIKNMGIFNKKVTVNLWPQGYYHERVNQNTVNNIASNKYTQKELIDNLNGTINKILIPRNSLPGIRIHNNHRFLGWNDPSSDGKKVSNNQTHNIRTSNKHKENSVVNNPRYYNSNTQYQVSNLPLKSNRFSQNTIKHSLLDQQFNPLFLRHRKYFQGNDKYNEEGFSQLPSVIRTKVKPSYFHYDLNHFDYIL